MGADADPTARGRAAVDTACCTRCGRTGRPPRPPATRRLPALARSGARRAGAGSGPRAPSLLFLLLWELGPRTSPRPRPGCSCRRCTRSCGHWDQLVANGQLQNHLQASLTRSATGFGIAVVAAVALGLLIAWYRSLDRFLNPLLELFRNTAALALLPVFTLLLGIGETSKITIVAYAAFFPVLLNTIAGVRTVDPLLIQSARSLGLSSFRLFQKVILPSAVPTIFTGIRMAGTSSILVLIAAEMVGAKAGLAT